MAPKGDYIVYTLSYKIHVRIHNEFGSIMQLCVFFAGEKRS